MTMPAFATHRRLLPGAFFLAMSQGLCPLWYFQGIERVRLVGSLWIAGRLLGALGLVLFVHSPADGSLAFFLQGTAPFLSFALGLAIAYREIPFVRPSLRQGLRTIRQGSSVFLYRAGTSLYTSLSVLALGVVASPLVVAWFAGAEKIARSAVLGLNPISQVLYPRISNLVASNPGAAIRTARMSLFLMLGFGSFAGISLYACAPILVRFLLGTGFEESVAVLRIFSILPLLIGLSGTLGGQWMLALRMDSELRTTALFAVSLNIACTLVLGRMLLGTGGAIAVIVTELFVALAALFVLWRRKLGLWRDVSPVQEAVA
jgi:PST family polysaccharide transporter